MVGGEWLLLCKSWLNWGKHFKIKLLLKKIKNDCDGNHCCMYVINYINYVDHYMSLHTQFLLRDSSIWQHFYT